MFVLLTSAAFAQQSAGDDMKQAGSATKEAVVKTGTATKKATVDSARFVKDGTVRAATATADGTKKAANNTGNYFTRLGRAIIGRNH